VTRVSDVAIEFDGLSKSFGKVQAVHDLSFSVQFGRVTGFLGPNGAGKSTTLRTLLGLIHPHAGTATFGGLRYERLQHPSAHVGAVLEEASFHPGRSGRNHLRILAAAGSHPDSRVSEVLEQVDLAGAADRRVKGYSMGMRQRLAIAAALLGGAGRLGRAARARHGARGRRPGGRGPSGRADRTGRCRALP
jgi:ABC-2 type transport system ATP-binding protein